MKKIAVISYAFGGSTLPLVKHLGIECGHVDYYMITGNTNPHIESFGSVLGYCHFPLVQKLHKRNEDIYGYLSESNSSVYLANLNVGFDNILITRPFARYKQKKFCKYINAQHYDLVIIIGSYKDNWIKFLVNGLFAKIVVNLHEVMNHETGDCPITDTMQILIDKNVNIVVHSQNSYKDILKYPQITPEYVHVINFGIFEGYKTIKCKNLFPEMSDYVLYIGMIRKYKGLAVLLEALRNNPECMNGRKLVIAGNGKDDTLEEFVKMPNVIVINRYVTVEEYITLVRNSRLIVCPYLTMSQSGIPQSVFAFGKPIIASDLDGLREIIKDGTTGLLFEKGNPAMLAECIQKLTTDQEFYNSLCVHVNNFEEESSEYSWQTLARKYLQLFT